MHYLDEQNIFLFLVQVFLLLGLARGAGELLRKWKQPALTGEILVGLLLGPTILGRFAPYLHNLLFPLHAVQQNMLETVAWLGILFLLLETGLEIDFSSAWRQRGDALKIALSDIIVPIVISFVACLFLPDDYLADPQQRLIFAAFMATVMTISDMPIAARALHDMKVLKTDLGFLIMSALSVNDIIGWLLFTLVLGIFTQTSVNVVNIFVIFGSTIGFTIFCLTAGRRFADFVIYKIKEKQMPQPGVSLTFICLLGLFCGAVTQKIGIHSLFGFFIAGIMAGEAKALSERTRQVISQMVHAIFVPLFFTNIGLKLDFLRNFDLLLVLGVSFIGIAARFWGAWLGVHLTKLSRANKLAIAVAHTPGGAMQIVVGILALEYGLITEPVFVAIIFGSIFSSIILGPWLNYSIKIRKEFSILEFFDHRAMVLDLKESHRDEAIMKLCAVASEREDLPDKEDIFAMVMRREREMGTALEDGVAVPHARVEALKRPAIIFGRSVSGLEWNSPDGKPTYFIFLILTPHNDDAIQIQILSAIARAMASAQMRSGILDAKDGQDVWKVFQDSLNNFNIKRKGVRSQNPN